MNTEQAMKIYLDISFDKRYNGKRNFINLW